jgi:parallel beta-helix repeat protein
VRNSRAYHNVAGIEIENSTNAEVYNCESENNTGGILVFDLPDLPKKHGGEVRVYSNKIYNNNYKNFAPKGNIVAQVPPGTGIMILATSDVEIFENTISDNRTVGVAVISYYMTEQPIKDKDYDPYPKAIFFHDNTFTDSKNWRPTFRNKIGLLLWSKFKKDVPNIVYDGIIDEEVLGKDGKVSDRYKICIQEKEGTTFANIDAEHSFKNIQRDIKLHDCEREPIKEVILGK